MFLRKKNLLALLVGGAGLSVTSLAFGHGALIDPPARQISCILNGEQWSGICKEASDKSNDGNAGITTWQQFTGFVGNGHGAEEAKKVIPGHLICSGTTQASGFNMASDKWKAAVVKPDINGMVKVRYAYTAQHTPSFTEFWITKKGVDPTKKVIGWDDVELLDTYQNNKDNPVIPSGLLNYKLTAEDFVLEIPADRTGRAVIFSRWQRIDSANEGFYGCSDVVITERGSDVIPTPEPGPIEDPAPSDWYEYAKFAEHTAPVVGSTVTFRVIGGTRGSDLVRITKPITAANVGDKWVSELATEINRDHSNQVLVGQKSNNDSIAFNPQQPRGNSIWLNHTGNSAVLSVAAPVNAPTAVVPANFEAFSNPDFSMGYEMDGSHSLNAESYSWKVVNGQDVFRLQEKEGGEWMLQSAKPVVRALIPANTKGTAIYELTVKSKSGETHSSRVTVTVKQKDEASDEYPDWQEGKTYVAGDKVLLNGIKFIAGYWTQSKPASSDAWKLADATQIVEWNATMTYVSGNNVSFKGKNYTAKQWTVGNQPDQSPQIWSEK